MGKTHGLCLLGKIMANTERYNDATHYGIHTHAVIEKDPLEAMAREIRDRRDLARYYRQLRHSATNYTGFREAARDRRFYGGRRYRGG